MWREKEHLCTVEEMQIDAATTENTMEVPENIKSRIIWSNNLTNG